MKTAIRREPVHLKFSDGQVIVTPKDMDTFVITAERAAEACREAIEKDRRFQQFQDELLVPVHEWCKQHADMVEACYIPKPRDYIKIFVVTKSRKFDFELNEDLAQLTLRLHQFGWPVSPMQLPASDEDSQAAFFSKEGALVVYAQG